MLQPLLTASGPLDMASGGIILVFWQRARQADRHCGMEGTLFVRELESAFSVGSQRLLLRMYVEYIRNAKS